MDRVFRRAPILEREKCVNTGPTRRCRAFAGRRGEPYTLDPCPRSPPPTPPPNAKQAGERWARIKAVFVEALELPESERGAFVARACEGDATLEREIESLLASEKAAANFIETPATGLLAQDALCIAPARAGSTTRRVRDHRVSVGRWNGRRVSSTAHGSRPTGRDQDGGCTRDGSDGEAPPRPRGTACVGSESPEHLHDLRGRRRRGHAVHRHAARRRAITARAVARRSSAARGCASHWIPGCRRARARASTRHHPPRSQELERRGRRHGEGNRPRLRPCQADPAGRDDSSRDSTLTAAGALAGTLSHMAPEVLRRRPGRRTERRVGARRPALRAGDGRAALHRTYSLRDQLRHSRRAAASHEQSCAARTAARDRAVPREDSECAVPTCGGRARRARFDCASQGLAARRTTPRLDALATALRVGVRPPCCLSREWSRHHESARGSAMW